MDTIFFDKIITARKNYKCDACRLWLSRAGNIDECATEDQRRIIKTAESNNYMIFHGQKYVKRIGVYCTDFYVYRAIPDMDMVCRELDLFDD